MLCLLYSDRSHLPGSNSLLFLDSSARTFFLLCTRRHSLFCLSEGQAQCQLTLASIGQQQNIHCGACASLHGSLSGACPTAHGRSGRPFPQQGFIDSSLSWILHVCHICSTAQDMLVSVNVGVMSELDIAWLRERT